MAKTYWTQDITLERLRALSIGKSGAGKTVFGTTWPDPVWIAFEKGLLFAKVHGIQHPVFEVERWEDMQELFADPPGVIKKSFGDYPAKTLIFDSASIMGNSTGVVMDMVLRSSTSKIMYPAIQEYGRVTDKMRGFFRLASELPYHVLVIANLYTEKDDLTGAIEDKPNFIGQMRNEAPVLMDFVFWHSIERSGTELRYVLETVKLNGVAKDRSDLLQKRYENPSFQMIWNDIQKGMHSGKSFA